MDLSLQLCVPDEAHQPPEGFPPTRVKRSYTGPNPTSAAPTKGSATTHRRTPVTPSGLAMLMAAVMASPKQIAIMPITRRKRGNGEARHVGVELPDHDGMIVENVYVPAGGDEPDRAINAKFGQKLDFLERMTRWADAIDRPTLIVGDFNIAPLESDVWNHKQLLKVVSHTPVEVESLQRFMDAHGWADIGREHIKAPERYYSWWSYRAKDWKANDRGRRLDHMWASPELAKQATGHSVHEYARDWEKPSDHVPLVTEFDI